MFSSPFVIHSSTVLKIQRRIPTYLRVNWFFSWLQDTLYRNEVLSQYGLQNLRNKLYECRKPSDFFDFAGLVFPSHQHRTEILPFIALAASREPNVVVEIGTAQSGTNFLLGQILTSAELIIALDLRVHNHRLLNEFSRKDLQRLLIEGSSYDPSTVQRVERVLNGRKIDLLFIDGDHSYSGVKADYDAYHHLVSPGGLIAFHDIVDDHRTRFGSTKSVGYAGQVPMFWKELKKGKLDQYFWEFIADPDQDGMGIGVLDNFRDSLKPANLDDM
jgi:cephalosporin hydroxylase